MSVYSITTRFVYVAPRAATRTEKAEIGSIEHLCDLSKLLEDEVAEQTTNHFLFNTFAFGGGVWGGAALKR